MTTFNTIDELIDLLRQNPQQADAVRRAILSDELLNLPATVQQLAASMATMAAALTGMNQGLESVESDVSTLKDDVSTLKGDMGRLKGGEYERQCESKALARALTSLGFSDVRVHKGPVTGTQPALLSALQRARSRAAAAEPEQEDVSNEAGDFLLADIIIADLGPAAAGGPPRSERREARSYALFEVSVTADVSDVARARIRADRMRAWLDIEVTAAVMTQAVPQQVMDLAAAQGVAVFIAPDD